MMLSSQIQTLELEIDTLRKSSNEFEKKKYYNIVVIASIQMKVPYDR